MKKVYNTSRIRLNLDTPSGYVAIQIISTLVIGLLILWHFNILPGFLNEGDGDWVEGFKKSVGMLPEEMSIFLVEALGVISAGFLSLQILKAFSVYIIVSEETFKWVVPAAKYLTYLPILNLKSWFLEFPLTRLEKVFSDLSVGKNSGRYGPFLRTFFVFGDGEDEFVSVIPGFVDFFDLLDELELRRPQAEWDLNTTFIRENYRKGISLYKSKKTINKRFKKEFKELVPSYWSRRKILSEAVKKHSDMAGEILKELRKNAEALLKTDIIMKGKR